MFYFHVGKFSIIRRNCYYKRT